MKLSLRNLVHFYLLRMTFQCTEIVVVHCFCILSDTLSNVDAGETAPTPVTSVLSLQNLMDANKFLVLFNVI